MTYNQIKEIALSDYDAYDTAYEYPDAYVFLRSPKQSEDESGEIIVERDGEGSPWAYYKDGSGSEPFYSYISALDFDPDEVDEDKGLGVLLDFETGSPV